MDSQGTAQWDDVYPSPLLFEQDIASQSLFVATVEAQLRGVIIEPVFGEIKRAFSDSLLGKSVRVRAKINSQNVNLFLREPYGHKKYQRAQKAVPLIWRFGLKKQ